MGIFWVYTNAGCRVGEFQIELTGEAEADAQWLDKTFALWCANVAHIDPAQHNYCIAAA